VTTASRSVTTKKSHMECVRVPVITRQIDMGLVTRGYFIHRVFMKMDCISLEARFRTKNTRSRNLECICAMRRGIALLGD